MDRIQLFLVIHRNEPSCLLIPFLLYISNFSLFWGKLRRKFKIGEFYWKVSVPQQTFVFNLFPLFRKSFFIKLAPAFYHQFGIIFNYLTLKRMECCHVLVKLKKCVHTKILSSPSVSLDPISVPNPNPKAINLAQSHVPPPIGIIVLYHESQSKVQVSELPVRTTPSNGTARPCVHSFYQ